MKRTFINFFSLLLCLRAHCFAPSKPYWVKGSRAASHWCRCSYWHTGGATYPPHMSASPCQEGHFRSPAARPCEHSGRSLCVPGAPRSPLPHPRPPRPHISQHLQITHGGAHAQPTQLAGDTRTYTHRDALVYSRLRSQQIVPRCFGSSTK